MCCSCRLAQIVCGRLVGVCRCGARAVTGSGSWWGGGGRWLERLWVGDGTTGARRRPTGAGTSSCVWTNCPDPCCPLWATSDVSVLLFVLASFCASIRCSRVSGWFAPRQLGGPGRGHRPTERPWVQPPGCAVAAGWCRSCGRGWLGSGGAALGMRLDLLSAAAAATDGWSGCGRAAALRVLGGGGPVRALRPMSVRTVPVHIVPFGPRLARLCYCSFVVPLGRLFRR